MVGRRPHEAIRTGGGMAKTHSPKFLSIVEQARSMIPECDAVQLREMLAEGQPLVVLDVRERHEYEAGRLAGSIHIGKGVIERDIEKHDFDDDARLVLYCGGGFRSAIAARSLKEMGYSNAISLWVLRQERTKTLLVRERWRPFAWFQILIMDLAPMKHLS